MPLIDLNGLGHFKDKENAMVAPDYSASATYAVGDHVFYNGTLYKCKTAITTAEAWTSGHWETAVVCDDITEINNSLTNNGNSIEFVTDLLEDDYTYSSVALTMTTNKRINSTGNVVDMTSADWSVSDLVDVSGNTFVRVCGSSGWTNLAWALYDANQNFISGYATGGTTEVFDNLVFLNDNVKYIRIAQIASVLKGSLYTIAGLDTEQIKNTLLDLVTPDEVNNITISLIDGKYIGSDHSIQNISGTQYKISNNIPVMPNEVLVISATVGYQTNMFYAFYNASDVYISGEASTEAGSKTFNVTVPTEATYLVVSAYQGNATVGKATSFKIKGKWTGKKWVCLGDSLTEVNSRTTKHYHDYIAEKTGISITNMGNSGSGYMKNQDINKAFYQIAENIPLDADVYTIFGSGNDLSLTLGTPTDTGTTTVCGCINETLDTLIGLLPTIQLGIVAPTPWSTYPPSTANNAMALYVDALKTICENRSIPFLDLYHCSNLRPWTAEGREACYSKDEGGGCHPDETGHKIIAPRFEGFLDSLLLA